MTDRELMQQALEAMGAVGADHICQASHHAKKDQHQWNEPCPLQQRWHIAFQALRERLAQPENGGKTGWPPGLLQDDDRKLSKWFASKPDARQRVREAVAQPQPRQWVGLTNSDLQPICDEYRILFGGWVHDFARAIEAKLREKNA